MTKLDYEPLIDKVRTRLLHWSHKPLSCAGRLQLIKSVIASITNFWCSAFILPQGCLDTIESMCNAFLWSGSPNDTHKSKVSWDDICYPKEEGGLGIRRLRETSLVFALSLIWRLFSSTGSLWVAWVKSYLLHGESFWDARDGSKGSWMGKKMLKLRDKAYPFIKYQIGDGKEAFFWFDNWLEQGKLLELRQLVALIQAAPVPNREVGRDVVLWRYKEGEYKDVFSAAATWDQIRRNQTKVTWFRTIWFAQGVPRYSFIAWLSILNRLAAGDRMRNWGHEQSCLFCGERDETRDHLFFACPYSYTLWSSLGGLLMTSASTPDWVDTLSFIISQGSRTMDSVLLRLLFQTSIYHVWRERNARERNARRHRTSWIPLEHLARYVDKAMRNQISSLNYRAPQKFEGLMRHWFEVCCLP
ncbi:unnamed protein product [Microthlaspi erraticum]|uniref:Reverse transcriptase zinc-binding domain-containing protein n=2 Tax=Microthlaspi erraticum TaxID=1685480 RepID=A0A6D2KB64_9BRAS|nr:unnamed protein product [Microthlaspi erraticum]